MLKVMAIFGGLAKMSTPEVLRLLGNRTGKLYLWPDPQKQFELHLHEGAVYCLKKDGVSVGDKMTLQKRVSELFSVRQGKFDFSPEDYEHARGILEFVTSRIPVPFIVGVTRQDLGRRRRCGVL